MAEAVQTAIYKIRTEGAEQLERLKTILGGVTVSEEALTAATGRAANSFERFAAKHDALIREQQRYEAELRRIARLQEEGRINDQQRVAALGLATATHERHVATLAKASGANDNLAKSTGLARHELINLGRQAQDIGVSLAGGQSFLTVMAQQGSQVFDVLATSQGGVGGALKSLGSTIAGLFTPARVLGLTFVGAAVAAAAAWQQFASQQKELEASLTGLGRGAGITAGRLNQVAEAAARTGGISTSASRDLAGTFAATGRIGPNEIGGAIGQTRALSLQLGLDLTEAGALLAKALSDPTKGAVELNEKLGFLDARTKELIRSQQAMGDRTAAQKTLLDAMAPSLSEAEKRVGALARAWNTVFNAASDAGAAMGGAISRALGQIPVGESIEAALRLRRGAVPAAPGTPEINPFAGLGAPDMRGQFQQRQRIPGAPSPLVEQFNDDMIAMLGLGAAHEDYAARMAGVTQEIKRQSHEISDIVRSVMPEIERRSTLMERSKKLTDALNDPKALASLNVTADQAREALTRLNVQQAALSTAAEKRLQDGQLEIDAIRARTLAERIDVAQRRAALEVLRQSGSLMEAAAAAEVARNTEIERANRQARDALRQTQDRAQLVGLFGLERRLKEIDLEGQRRKEELAGAGKAADLPTILRGSNDNFLTRLQANQADFLSKLLSALTGGVGLKGVGVTVPGVGGTLTSPQALPGGATFGAAAAGMDVGFKAALDRMMAAIPGISITSGYRSPERQAELFADAVRKHGSEEAARKWVAPPGRSMHGFGMAADLGFATPAARAEAHRRAAEFGLRFPMGHEPWHVEPIGGRGARGGATSTAAATIDADVALQKKIEVQTAEISIVRDARLANEELAGANRVLGDSIGKTTGQLAAANRMQELENQARRERLALTPALLADLEKQAAGYGKLIDEQERLRRQIGEFSMWSQELGSALGDAFKGIALEGKNASEVLDNLFKRLASRAIDQLFSMLFNAGGAQGGLLGALFGGFGGGAKMELGGIMTGHGPLPLNRYDAGGVAYGPQLALFGEGRRPEAYVPLPDGRSIPVTMQAPANQNRQGGVKMNVQVFNEAGARIETRQMSDTDIAIFVKREIRQSEKKADRTLEARASDKRMRSM